MGSRLRRWGSSSCWLLAVEEDMLLINRIGNLGSLAEEVEILADRGVRRPSRIPKCIVVEGIVRLIKLVAQPVIGILKVEFLAIVVGVRKSGERIVGLREARGSGVVARGIKAKERHFEDGRGEGELLVAVSWEAEPER